MSKFSWFSKSDLQSFAAEFRVRLVIKDTIPKIIRKIEALHDYKNRMALNQISIIEKN